MNVYINSIIVFTNAFVKNSGEIKGIKVINKNFLLKEILRAYDKNNRINSEKNGKLTLNKITSFVAIFRLKEKSENKME